MNATSFYSYEELQGLGLKKFGQDVCISRKASLYGCEYIELGNHVRIDDFCVLSGSICIGDYVHVAVATLLFGGQSGIIISDYCNISSRTAVYALSDDYSGKTMTNPLIPNKYKNVVDKEVVLHKHVIIGTGSTILPGCIIGEGTAVGAMSLINQDTIPWNIYAGIPAHILKPRDKNLLDLEKKFKNN